MGWGEAVFLSWHGAQHKEDPDEVVGPVEAAAACLERVLEAVVLALNQAVAPGVVSLDLWKVMQCCTHRIQSLRMLCHTYLDKSKRRVARVPKWARL